MCKDILYGGESTGGGNATHIICPHSQQVVMIIQHQCITGSTVNRALTFKDSLTKFSLSCLRCVCVNFPITSGVREFYAGYMVLKKWLDTETDNVKLAAFTFKVKLISWLLGQCLVVTPSHYSTCLLLKFQSRFYNTQALL